MMKANEIMIGDWVRLEYKNPNTGDLIRKDFQVDQIVRPWRDEPHDMWSKENGNMGQVAYMMPIPLTAEILEKNGFVFDGTQRWKTKIKTEEIFVCPVQPDNEWWDEFSTGFQISSRIADVTIDGVKQIYVHELQHALRLCGLTELADNFKV